MSIRLVTYNIRLGIQVGLEPIAELMEAERPDILAIQEVGRHWVMGPDGDTTRELATLLGLDHYVFVPSLTRGAAHYGHALLSAHPFLSAGFRRLPMDVDEPRTVLESQIEHPEGVVRVISTHLSHIDDRPPQGAELVGLLEEQLDLPTVIIGDLNATDEDDFLQVLLERTVDADPSGQHTFPAHAPTRRIDYILARDGVLGDTVVSTDTRVSDHRYVATTWSFQDRSSNRFNQGAI